MRRGLCGYCHLSPIVGRCRKFCTEHSRQASTIWKRLYPGDRTDWNVTPEKRRAYFREYMREYRRRQRHPGAA
jgi:hypothetical protein